MFTTETLTSESNKRNNTKILKVLVNKKDKKLVSIPFNKSKSIRLLLKDELNRILHTSKYRLEQVYTLGDTKFYEDNNIDIIHIGLVNLENVKLDKDYEFVEIDVKTNNYIKFIDESYNYKTTEFVVNSKEEYYHEVETDNLELEKELVELLITYKYLKGRITTTPVIFDLLPDTFTLEDIRIIYELIREENVDKSNFHKKYSKYCEKVNKVIADKGYRPAQVYRYKEKQEDKLYR
jgi:hypothetical protein